MRATSFTTVAALATIFSGVLADWNPHVCNGAGGCSGVSWWPDTDYSCPNGVHQTAQQVAQATTNIDAGQYTVLTAADFPKVCARGVVPPSNGILVLNTTPTNKYYSFLTETCTQTAPEEDCYDQYPNPVSQTICQIETLDGQICSQVFKSK